MTSPRPLPFPAELQAPGTADASFTEALPVSELPPGGLDADGEYRPTWTPAGAKAKAPLKPDDPKARARAMTRVRRLRYYPVRVRDGVIEVAWPA